VWRHLTRFKHCINHLGWLGNLGFQNSRPKYTRGPLETAHSRFLRLCAGGGLVQFCPTNGPLYHAYIDIVRRLCRRETGFFCDPACCFIACLLFGFTGGGTRSVTVARVFGFARHVLPWLYQQSLDRAPQSQALLDEGKGNCGKSAVSRAAAV